MSLYLLGHMGYCQDDAGRGRWLCRDAALGDYVGLDGNT